MNSFSFIYSLNFKNSFSLNITFEVCIFSCEINLFDLDLIYNTLYRCQTLKNMFYLQFAFPIYSIQNKYYQGFVCKILSPVEL